jgi:hypothetical protein
MNIDHLENNFDKRRLKKNLQYYLNEPASEENISKAEFRLDVTFPDQVKLFYRHHNGLIVKAPPIEILNIEKLYKTTDYIVFALVDERNKLCFDCSRINEADQWDIVSYDSGYKITLTFASFWSNKIWAWIDKQRRIWEN